MKKIILFFFIFTFSITAQEFQGKAYYMSKTILNTDFIKNIPQERRKASTVKNEVKLREKLCFRFQHDLLSF